MMSAAVGSIYAAEVFERPELLVAQGRRPRLLPRPPAIGCIPEHEGTPWRRYVMPDGAAPSKSAREAASRPERRDCAPAPRSVLITYSKRTRQCDTASKAPNRRSR